MEYDVISDHILWPHFFKAKISLQGVFIDAFYDSGDDYETENFSENVQKLWDFAVTADPFECKDIKKALTELMEAQVGQVTLLVINQLQSHLKLNTWSLLTSKQKTLSHWLR